MKLQTSIIIALSCFMAQPVMARECHLSKKWQQLCPVLQSRIEQTSHKMKLSEKEAQSLENYIHIADESPTLRKSPFFYLSQLQSLMPKTTTELWMAIYQRGLSKNEAEKMAKYLREEVNFYKFKHLADFDNNTSHIIGREWHEIDYGGENMTWKKQKEKYAPYGISNFKSVACLKKFFPVESKLPYFNKVYQPLNTH